MGEPRGAVSMGVVGEPIIVCSGTISRGWLPPARVEKEASRIPMLLSWRS